MTCFSNTGARCDTGTCLILTLSTPSASTFEDRTVAMPLVMDSIVPLTPNGSLTSCPTSNPRVSPGLSPRIESVSGRCDISSLGVSESSISLGSDLDPGIAEIAAN